MKANVVYVSAQMTMVINSNRNARGSPITLLKFTSGAVGWMESYFDDVPL